MIEILIRYLGIKTKLIDEIKREIIKNTSKKDVVLDLFGGSNTVANSLLEERIVYTNDIQKYSYCAAQTIIKGLNESERASLRLEKIINSAEYKENIELLEGIFYKPLKYESEVINILKTNGVSSDTIGSEELMALKELYDNMPYTGNYNRNIDVFSDFEKFYTDEYYKECKSNNKYMLFTLAYSMPYFTLNQSIVIDSYRCAADKLLEKKEITKQEYYAYLSALMYLLQNIVCSVGDHFAQPQQLKIIDEKKYIKEINKIISKKSTDIFGILNNKINEISLRKFTSNDNKCFNYDAINLLKNEEVFSEVNAVYMDPPYTNAHYSRFYHILETLINYNYPILKHKGRYSEERVQSQFCIKTKALESFEEIIKICSEKNKKIFVSYSDTSQCLVQKEELVSMCEKYYKSVYIKEINHLYRNFGQKPRRVEGNELLITCN